MNIALLLMFAFQIMTGHHRVAIASSPPPGIVVINTAIQGNTTVVSNQSTHTLGFSTGSGHFLVAESIGAANSIDSATLQPSGTSMNCPTDSKFSGDRNFITVCYLANAPSGQTSVNWSYTSSSGSTVTQFVGEYSGMSLTATEVNTTVQCRTGFVATNSWTCGPYTATAANLVWTTCSPNTLGPSTIVANSPWNIRKEWDSGTAAEMWFFDILGPSSGSYTGGGTFSLGAGSGVFYDCEIGSYK